jgi:hypothetical protein
MVYGYTGLPGSAKTLSVVAHLWQLKQKGRKVFANIPLIDRREKVTREYHFFGRYRVGPRNERTYGRSWGDGFLVSLDEMLRCRDGEILLDEVHTWAGAHAWQKIPDTVRSYLSMQRKDGVNVHWTAQDEQRVFNQIRELTGQMWDCQRYGPWSVQECMNLRKGKKMGKRVFTIGPQWWDLFMTAFVIGNKDGKGGRAGARTYKKRKPWETRRFQLLMERVVLSDGYVQYLPASDVWRPTDVVKQQNAVWAEWEQEWFPAPVWQAGCA